MGKMTINTAFQNTVQTHGSKSALSTKIEGEYVPITYNELADRVRNFALGLRSLGVERGDRVSLLSENRREWAISDLAILSLGAINVPLYTTLTPQQVRYIVNDSQSKVIIVSHKKQLQKVEALRSEMTDLQKIVIFDRDDSSSDTETFNQLLQIGAKVENGDQIFKDLSVSAEPHDLATIIYTSGTTGDPKGAMLTHDNFVSNTHAGVSVLKVDHDDIFLSFLPLSHIFERMAGHYIPLFCGGEICYAESPFTVANNMREVRPTVMASVPRLYEMMHDKILRGVQAGSPLKQSIFHWAVGIGSKKSQTIQKGRNPNPILGMKASIADKLVFSKIKEATGGRLRFFVSGGAPLPQAIAEFFHAAGILILEGYGLTETSPVISANTLDHFKFGKVGRPIPGVEVQIAEDGEILSRGPHIMKGYFNKPEATAEAIDPDGWFHTGDIGEFDSDGFLKVTDRKKNILVLSNGKNVAPQPIESKLKQSEFINQVMLIGDNQKSIAALIVPSFDAIKAFAKKNGISGEMADLIESKEIQSEIGSDVDKCCEDFADFERVKMFRLIDREFSAEADEITPTLKLKRRVIMENHKDKINEMYS